MWVPNFTPNQIMGVQPMAGSTGQIYSMRYEYTYIGARPVDPNIYKYFLRLNNRRRTQSDQDFADAGYHFVHNISGKNTGYAYKWCQQQFGEWGFHYPVGGKGKWWFCQPQDAMMFELTWG